MSKKPSDNEIRLAILLGSSLPKSTKPSVEEIIDWQERRLTKERRKEVGSHIAHDPECYAIWSEYIDYEDQDLEPVTSTVKHSFFFGIFKKFKYLSISTGLVFTSFLLVVFLIPTTKKEELKQPSFSKLEVLEKEYKYKACDDDHVLIKNVERCNEITVSINAIELKEYLNKNTNKRSVADNN